MTEIRRESDAENCDLRPLKENQAIRPLEKEKNVPERRLLSGTQQNTYSQRAISALNLEKQLYKEGLEEIKGIFGLYSESEMSEMEVLAAVERVTLLMLRIGQQVVKGTVGPEGIYRLRVFRCDGCANRCQVEMEHNSTGQCPDVCLFGGGDYNKSDWNEVKE